MYKKLIDVSTGLESSSVLRLIDGWQIPPDPDNTDYQEYLKWLAEGNEPLPADGE